MRFIEWYKSLSCDVQLALPLLAVSLTVFVVAEMYSWIKHKKSRFF